MTDICISKFLDKVRLQNKNSAETIGYYLEDFEVFCVEQLPITDRANPVCEVIKKLKAGTWNKNPKEEQPYEVLAQYASWLTINRIDTGRNNARTVKYKINWARQLFEINYIPISKTIFKMQVKSPRQEEPDTSPIEKKTVSAILLALADIRMRSYVMFLASSGWRATESLSLCLSNFENLDLKTCKFTGTPYVNASGRMAKTKKGKRRQLTNEMARQIEKLLVHTYRRRTIARKVGDKWQKIPVVATPKGEDMMFARYHSDVETRVKRKGDSMFNLYMSAAKQFRITIDNLGIAYEDSGKRRKVTLHTFRRFVFTQCERAVSRGYADYHVGRKIHEYIKRTPEQIAEDFASVEPYLTFLDTTAMDEKQKAITIELQTTRKELRELKDFQQSRTMAWQKETHPDWTDKDWDRYYDEVGQP